MGWGNSQLPGSRNPPVVAGATTRLKKTPAEEEAGSRRRLRKTRPTKTLVEEDAGRGRRGRRRRWPKKRPVEEDAG
jgi:hypothetical protein